jgi:hypothetical protein
VPLRRPFHEPGRDGAGLGHQRKIPARCGLRREGRVEAGGRRHDAETVRPDEPQAVPARGQARLVRERARPRAQSGREHDRDRDAPPGRGCDEARHGPGRRRDDGEIRRLGQVLDPGHAGQAVDLGVARVHGVD